MLLSAPLFVSIVQSGISFNSFFAWILFYPFYGSLLAFFALASFLVGRVGNGGRKKDLLALGVFVGLFIVVLILTKW
jgi:hypothetical protein